MILVGLEDCASCKIAHGILTDVEYVVIPRSKPAGPTDPVLLDIKRALGKLNPDGHFPVILSDDKTKMINTEDVLNNLNKNKLEEVLVNK